MTRIHVGTDPDYAMYCHGRIWVSDLDGTQVWEIDPAKNAVVARPRIGAGSAGFAYAGAVWSVNYETGKLLKLDWTTGKVLARLGVGSRLREVVLALGDLWISDQSSGNLVRVKAWIR